MSKNSICIVDDSKDLLYAYTQTLKKIGDIMTFDSPVSFLKYLENHPDYTPDLVLTDLSMPEMDGLEMVTKAQTEERFFPSILISGHLTKDKAIEATRIGVWRMLEKPVVPKELIDTAKELLQEHEIHKIRTELRKTMVQTSEMFTAFRILCMNELDLDVTKRKVIQASPGEENMTLDEALTKLELRLKNLAKSEAELGRGMKNNQRSRAA